MSSSARGTIRRLAPLLAALAVIAAIVVAALALGDEGADETAGSGPADPGAPAESKPRGPARSKAPNIIAITTDDMTLGQFRRGVMPQTFRRIVDPGTSFTDSIVTTPLCCPSRASFITGQYGHNNGVLNNNPGYGLLRRPGNVLPVWLQRAGYRTAHVGKYLNRYNEVLGNETVPPGWDRWYSIVRARDYFGYRISSDGELTFRGIEDSDYVTRVLDREAVRLVRRLGGGERPYYLQLDEFAPHPGENGGVERGERCARLPVPDPRDDGSFADAPLPRPRSFNEADVSDKPPFIRDQRLTARRVAELRLAQRCALESLQAVDRGIARIDRALRRSGERRRTVVIFTSDNGTPFGEHREGGKLLAYEESIRVPLVIRAPRGLLDGADAPASVERPVANIDIAPTILELAGARPCLRPGDCRVLDGRSLLGLLGGEADDWPDRRPLGIEFATGSETGRAGRPCAYHGVRVDDAVYIEYPRLFAPDGKGCRSSEAAELYDLEADPEQLENLIAAGAGETDERAERLARTAARLQRCSGIEGRDRRRAGRPFCS